MKITKNQIRKLVREAMLSEHGEEDSPHHGSKGHELHGKPGDPLQPEDWDVKVDPAELAKLRGIGGKDGPYYKARHGLMKGWSPHAPTPDPDHGCQVHSLYGRYGEVGWMAAEGGCFDTWGHAADAWRKKLGRDDHKPILKFLLDFTEDGSGPPRDGGMAKLAWQMISTLGYLEMKEAQEEGMNENKLTRIGIRKIINQELLSHSKRMLEAEYRGSGFSPEEALDMNTPEMQAHLKNIQSAQTDGDSGSERAAILSFLEDVSEALYDEARHDGSIDASGRPSHSITDELNHALELGEYVQRALSDESYDKLGWIDAVSQKAAEGNDAIGGVWSDEKDYEAGFMREFARVSLKRLGEIIKEEITRVTEGEVIDFPQDPKLPWVFGPEGYIKRSELSQQYEKKEDIGPDSPPEVMIARAMAYRASELTNYQQEFDDEIFSDYAMRIYHDYVLGKSGNKDEMLDSMLNRIDDGGWSDEDIMDIAHGGEQYYGLSPGDDTEMSQTKDLASQQDPDEVEEMGMDFERFLQGIESGDVVELEQED